MKIYLILLFLCLITISYSQKTILVQGANVLNTLDGTIDYNVDLIIRDGKFISIEKASNQSYDEIVKAEGKWVIPGLIDSHIHLFQSGGLYTRPDAIDFTDRRPYTQEIQWVKDNVSEILKSYLRVGITSVVEIGGPMLNYQFRKDYHSDNGHPNLYLTGPLISTYQPEAFKIDDPPIIKVNTQEEARQQVRNQIPYDPDFIKIWYISLPNLTADQTFDIVKAAIDESHKHGIRVYVHATQLNTAKLAVHAGADVLVHSVRQPIDEEFVQMLLDGQVSYIPTLNVSANYNLAFLDQLNIEDHELEFAHPEVIGQLLDVRHLSHPDLDWAKENRIALMKRDSMTKLIENYNLKLLADSGVRIATGTDAGNIGTLHVSSYWREVQAMKMSGLSNFEILKASTIDAAVAVGKETEIGSIEPGKQADFLILNENPIESLEALLDIDKVFVKGVEVDLVDYQESTPEDLAQKQLNAYNQKNIEEFLKPYSDSVHVYSFPDELLYVGKEKMRATYKAFFERTPLLHCELKNRIVLGNTVIDQELVTGLNDGSEIRAVAIYKVRNGKIQEVYFDGGN